MESPYEEYPLRPQARLLVTVIEDGGAEDAQGERRSWSALSKHAMARVFSDDEPEYSAAAAVP